jgi:hypothetical protein
MSKEYQDISVAKLVKISREQNSAMDVIKSQTGISQSHIIRRGIDLAIEDYSKKIGKEFGFNFEELHS